MRRAAVLAMLAVLAGCTPGADPVPPSSPVASVPSTATPSPSATVQPLGEAYDLPADRDVATWGQPMQSLVGRKLSDKLLLSREGWRVDLMGVYRLADNRVLAEFRVNAQNAVTDEMQVWSDPDYDWWIHKMDRRNGGYRGAAWEFSDVALTVAGDDATYRSVRTKTNHCLCSMNTASELKNLGDFPAYVVLSAPEGASTVDLAIRDVGTFADVAVSPAMPQRSVVPLGRGYQLRLQAVSRPSSGVVRARFSVEAPASGLEGSPSSPHMLSVIDGGAPWEPVLSPRRQFLNLLALDPVGEYGGWPRRSSSLEETCTSCTTASGGVVQPGTAVDLQIDLPDPGTPTVMIASTAAWPFSPIAVDGTATRSEQTVRYRWQQVDTGGTIADDGLVLDTAVLFAFDKATLTAKANNTLDRAAKALQAQDKRSLVVVGHTDSVGSTAHNLDLSRRRAAAVRDALAQRLGSGWTFTVQGKGESDPAVKEGGLSGNDLKRAQARNRRVEVSVK
jgi:outer membrane protein OmpA-like peptidoglycan-associated protein